MKHAGVDRTGRVIDEIIRKLDDLTQQVNRMSESLYAIAKYGCFESGDKDEYKKDEEEKQAE